MKALTSRRKLARRLANAARRRGNILVLAAAMMVMIFGFTSFTADVGFITLTKAQLQTAVETSTLAASLELAQGLGMGAEKTPADITVLANQAVVDVAALHRAGDKSTVFADPQRDVRYGQVYWDASSGSWIKSWGTSPYNMVEVTLHRDQAEGTPDGSLPLFFGPVIGHDDATLIDTATAALIPGSGFNVVPGSGQTTGILPITLDEPTWNTFLEDQDNGFSSEFDDDFSYDPETGQVSNGSDGMFEMDLYPQGTNLLPPGNRGTVDMGSPNNSTSDLARQILYGLNEFDLSYFPDGISASYTNPLYINGDTGLSAGMKDELEAIKGLPRAIPIFTEVSGPGNNATYTIVKFVGIRLVDVKLTGNPKHVLIQISPFSDSTVTHTGTVTVDETYIFTTPRLIN
jgi:hypothetical protein